MFSLRCRVIRRVRWLFSRWSVATVLDRSSRTCWANLVSWALDGGKDARREIGVGYCRSESITHPDRSCYCGKFRNGCLTRKQEMP